MPKEEKSVSKRSKRHSLEGEEDDVSRSGVRGSVKSAVGTNRYSPFMRTVPRREMQADAMTLTQVLHPKNCGFIENGIKYIMFPLHLLRFCIFGGSVAPICSANDGPTKKEKVDEKTAKEKGKRDEKKEAISEKSPPERSTLKETRKNPNDSSTLRVAFDETVKETKRNEDSMDEMVTAAEDSDSSEQWNTANSSMIMNMSIDRGNSLNRSLSYLVAEEPMDVSMEEALEKSYSTIKVSRDVRLLENVTINATCAKPRGKQESNSVDEEIARIFQEKCTSSDDENPAPHAARPARENSRYCDKCNSSAPKARRELYNAEDRKSTADSAVKKSQTREEEAKRSARSEDKKEAKRSSRQETPKKSRSRSSGTPTKSRSSKHKDVVYKEKATQTDSAFSDEDVEMIPIEVKQPEKRFCSRFAVRKSHADRFFQVERMDQDLDYVADNEDSNDGSVELLRRRISSGSTSSSSTDLGFEERAYAKSDMDFRLGRRPRNLSDSRQTRAPPGFPELPQNPPLTPASYDASERFAVNGAHDSTVQATPVAPAPPPMRHLYYDYPEFMNLPENVSSSKILCNILRNNYCR